MGAVLLGAIKRNGSAGERLRRAGIEVPSMVEQMRLGGRIHDAIGIVLRQVATLGQRAMVCQ
jgi:hypothetical protein